MYQAAELISVGTELLLGNIANTDAQRISQALAAVGINVLYHTVVGDNPQRLEEVIGIARKRADLLIFTGGLGPTYDDLTKESVCRALGVKLVYHPEIEEEIRAYIDRNFHLPMTDCNRQQAWLPEGCTIFRNEVGTAPGCAVVAGDTTAILLPGVPRECDYLLEHAVLPYLTRAQKGVIVSHNVRVFGLGEPKVQEKLAALMNEAVNPSVAPYAKTGEVLVRLTAKASDEAAGEAMLAPVLTAVCNTLGECVYGVDVAGLEDAVLRLFKARHLTFSTAESCTGGWIAKRITDLSGASEVFRGGVVSYTNDVKAQVLGVERAMLDRYGAVSQNVAEAMAQGVRRLTGSDLAVSVTGVAGPDRDDRGNEVGTVFVALDTPDGTFVRSLHLSGGRELIRIFSAHHAFDMLRRYLSGITI
jgi:nicotinamide-nucleotide amidase